MGQLTNQYVSQSYQGLLNLENPFTGVTNSLQYVTDGLGGNTALQLSQTQVNITGSLTVNGQPVSFDTGSLVTTSSFNAFTSSMNSFTSSIDSRVDALEIETGSLQNQINQKLDTGSFNTYSGNTLNLINQKLDTGSFNTYSGNTLNLINQKLDTGSFNSYTGSNDAKVNSLISQTGSYVTETESGSFVTSVTGSTNTITVTKGNGSQNTITVNNVTSASFANNATSASFAQNALSASWAPDNSNRNGLITTGSIGGNQSITGSLNVSGTISATSASFTYINTVYETASVIYSSGSNQFGDASNDTQTLYGTIVLPNLDIHSGSTSNNYVTWNNITQNVEYKDTIPSASYALNATSASYALNATSASFAQNVVSASFAATSSIAFDVVVYGKCNNTSGLLRGTVVRIVGADGNNPLFDSASWTDDANSANTLGVLSEDVAYNAFANVVVQGKLAGINTSGFTEGDLMFLSASGQYTTQSVPAPYHEVRLGQVLRVNQNQGSMYVNIDNGYELTELHDVDITSPAVGDVLTYVSGAYGQWVNKDGSELGYATTGSNTFVGQQTILNDLVINSSNPFGTFVNMISTGTTSFNMDSPLTQFQSNGQMVFTNTLASTGSSDISFLTQNGGDIILNTSNSGSVAITGSVNVSGSSNFIGNKTIVGNQTITGSVNISGSQSITNNLRLYSSASYGNSSVQPGAYITQSLPVSSSNIFFSNAGTTGQLPIAASQTGSIVITGSNNIFFSSNRVNTLVTQGTIGYVEGSFNTIQVIPTITTQSLVTPNTPFIQGNNLQATVVSSNISSSLAGNVITNNYVLSSTNLLHNSGSIGVSNNLILGAIASNQNVTPAKNQASLNNNLVINSTTLTHNSSSISSVNNIIGGLTIINDVSSSFTANNNGIGVNRNIINGNANTIYTTGSMSSSTQRFFTDNLIVGRGNIISSSFIANNNSNLLASAVVGQNLVVSGSHTTTSGGSAFFGRFNDTGSLALSQDIVFAVGTGTGTSNRRTGFWIDSGSVVNVSGSLFVNNQQITAINTGSFITTGSNATTQNITGSLIMSGSGGGSATLTLIGNDNNQQQVLKLVTGSIQLGDTSGSLRIAGYNNQPQVFFNPTRRIGFFLGQSNMDQTDTAFGLTSGSTDNYTFGGNFNNFRTGSYNLMLANQNISLRSGSYNVILASDTSYTTGSNNLILGKGPSGIDEVQNYFNVQLPQNSDPIMFKSGSSNPLTIKGNLGVSGSASITGSAFIDGDVKVSGSKGVYSDSYYSRNNAGIYIGGNEEIQIEPGSLWRARVTRGGLQVTGSFVVTGSAVITGSVQGNVNALSVTSNTASLNLNNGNFFTLQLISGSDVRIEPSNIKAGQTVNVLLSTTGSGTVSFPSSVKQVSGSAYVPTTGTGKDVITLVSFDSSDLYLANVKNLI